MFLSVCYSLDCIEGEEVELWGDCKNYPSYHSDGCMSSGCYSIQATTQIDLSFIDISPRQIPLAIGNLINLTQLRMEFNELTGVIPDTLTTLTNLTNLNLNYNYLTGDIPENIVNMTNLTSLSLTHNQVGCKTINPDWGGGDWNWEISCLELCDGANGCIGKIPESIDNLENLSYLYLGSNQLSGEMPANIGNMTNLTYFQIYKNQLSGYIPESICQINFIFEYFYLFQNQFCPPYPECLSGEQFNDINGNGIWDTDEPFEDFGSDGLEGTNDSGEGNGEYDGNYIGEQDTSNCSSMSITDNLIPTIHNLSNPYPNPFNPATTISFSIPEFGLTTITAYDITGRQLETLTNEVLTMGSYAINWNASDYPSGVYLIRMVSDEFTQTQKVVLVK